MNRNICILSLTGSSYYIGAYANELVQRDDIDDVHVFLPDFSQEIEILDTEQIDIKKIAIEDSIVKSLFYTLNIEKILDLVSDIREVNPDVIHIINEMRVPFFFPYILKKCTGLPIVLTVHEPNPKVPTAKRRIILNPLQKLNLTLMSGSIDQFIVHGQQLKEELVNLGPNRNCINVVPHGSFAEFFTTNSQEAPQETRTVLFFGRSDAGKGIPYLIKAADRLKHEFSDLRVILARYDSDTYGDLDSDVFETYEERLEETKVCELFQRASVVILPYTDASISGIVSIAAGFSTPVIVTDAGSLPELVDDGFTGLVVPSGDSIALCESIKTLLLDDDMRSQMGERLSRVQHEIYSWERVAAKTMSTYEDCIHTSR
jgi:glycosyltransferase involved in cell wall biosynthesis